jgi:hypothetical protein
MRPRSPERVWCDRHQFDYARMRRLNIHRLQWLEENQPAIFQLMIRKQGGSTDGKDSSQHHS